MELSPLLLICILQVFGYFLFYDEMIMLALSFRHFQNDEEFKEASNMYEYSGLVFTFIYFLFADVLRYRWFIILGSISLLLRYLSLVPTSTLFLVNVSIFWQALAGSCLKATLPYMYSIEDRSNYQKITAYVEGSEYLCIFFSDAWDKLYWKSGVKDDTFLHTIPIYMNAIMLCIVLPCCYILPPVDSKRFLDTEGFDKLPEVNTNNYSDSGTEDLGRIIANPRSIIIRQWNNFKAAYTNFNVLKWSIWYSVIAYMSPLNHYYNVLLLDEGATSTTGSSSPAYMTLHLIGSLIILLALLFISRHPTDWKTRGDQILCSISFFLLALAISQYFSLHQLIQIVFMETSQIITEVFCAVCLWEIAQIIPRNSYALVLGFNMFVAKVLDAISPDPNNLKDFIDSKIILIHMVLLALLGVGFGYSAKRNSRSQLEQ